ncbi:MAG: sodium:proton antiporter NhaD [Bacteroidetes bacterium]|nr:sodium:proton antiporter NhaD [Bacteroidota bacterium]
MFYLMIVVFVIGYTAIALEHPLRVNKSATALLLAVAMWFLFTIARPEKLLNQALLHHLGEISGILFFLLGAMTIIELIDSHEGFRIITDRIKTTNKVKLLWVISIISFFLSAVLDNLTTAIVMVALLRKLIGDKKERWFFAGMVIIAANSGGAFSPIGDVTTIMLWIAGHVTTVNIIVKTVLPSALSMVIPLLLISITMKGDIQRPYKAMADQGNPTTPLQRNIVFFLGTGLLLFVPVFKALTGLPPYMGILLALGILWVVTEIMHKSKNDEYRSRVTVAGVVRRIDTPIVLFFLGILLAVAALDSAGHLELLAASLDQYVGNLYIINVIIGLLSSIVDNVPLVAGAMGMYQNTFPPDHYFWEMLAYCAGTGGSILIIGSAAGVAVMGMEKIDFIWYLKNISLWALIGYLAGSLAYWGLSVVVFTA